MIAVLIVAQIVLPLVLIAWFAIVSPCSSNHTQIKIKKRLTP
jgi:hypothetical protein